MPWRRKWQPLQYSCLENPMDRRAGGLQSSEPQRLIPQYIRKEPKVNQLAFLDTTDVPTPLTSQGPNDKEKPKKKKRKCQTQGNSQAAHFNICCLEDDSVCKRLNPEAFVNKWLPEGRAMGIYNHTLTIQQLSRTKVF